jgi:predicted secreted protein
MAAQSARDLRIKYDSGSGPVVIAGATSDNLTITKGGINITDKDDAGVQTFIADAVGTFAMSATVSGIMKGTQLSTLARDATQFLYDFEIDVPGDGTYAGEFGITSFEMGGADQEGAVTFSCELTSGSALAYTAE